MLWLLIESLTKSYYIGRVLKYPGHSKVSLKFFHNVVITHLIGHLGMTLQLLRRNTFSWDQPLKLILAIGHLKMENPKKNFKKNVFQSISFKN